MGHELISRIKNLFSDIRYKKAIIVLAVCGIILIFISGQYENNNSVESRGSDFDSAEYSMNEYAENTERKLSRLLQSIDGVGKAEVMVTVSCTEEYVYAEEEKSDITESDGKNSVQRENKFVFSGNGSQKEAIVRKIISPQINGVVVVCEGGGNSSTAESIYNAVSVALGIPTNRIYVTSTD